LLGTAICSISDISILIFDGMFINSGFTSTTEVEISTAAAGRDLSDGNCTFTLIGSAVLITGGAVTFTDGVLIIKVPLLAPLPIAYLPPIRIYIV